MSAVNVCDLCRKPWGLCECDPRPLGKQAWIDKHMARAHELAESAARSGHARREAILRLLDTRFDNLPEPTVRTHHQSGFVHGRAELSCPDCLANGRSRMIGCETCGGSGVVVEKRRRDPYMKNDVTRYGFTGEEHDHRVALDEAIRTAGRELTRFPGFRPASSQDEIAEANKHPYGWELARDRMYELFDYAALDIAVDELLITHPGVSPRSMRGLDFIDGHMPDPIRAPDAVAVAQPEPGVVVQIDPRAERDARILELARSGEMSAEQIGVAVGCSMKTVYRTLGRLAA
jgi:hypothetical protein